MTCLDSPLAYFPTTGGARRAVRAISAGLAALALAGCPQGFSDPKRTPAPSCESVADCNEGRVCGDLKLCVDGACESEASFVRVCEEDAGVEDASADAQSSDDAGDGADAGSS